MIIFECPVCGDSRFKKTIEGYANYWRYKKILKVCSRHLEGAHKV